MSLIALLILVVVLVSMRQPRVWLAGFLEGPQPDSKADAIHAITRMVQKYNIDLNEVELALANEPALMSKTSIPEHPRTDVIKKICAYLGGVFLLSGIGTYTAMFWADMGSFMHIFITLGVGFMLFGVLVVALREQKFPQLVIPLVILAALMQTTGWFVTIHELFPQGKAFRQAIAFVTGIMAIQQATLFYHYRRPLFCLIALIFAYLFLHTVLDLAGMEESPIELLMGGTLVLLAKFMSNSTQRSLTPLAIILGFCWFNAGLHGMISLEYNSRIASIITGLSGCAAAYGLQCNGRYPLLSGFGYLCGSMIFYTGFFDLVSHTPYELVYLAVAVGMLYVCTLLRSTALLVTSLIAILGFIAYFTNAHFLNVIGWPVVLMLAGIVLLGLSACAVKIRRAF